MNTQTVGLWKVIPIAFVLLASTTTTHAGDKARSKLPTITEIAETTEGFDILYAALQAAGLEVLYDDRDETPGVKFNDADLIGIPIRITIGERSLKDGNIEIKLRKAEERGTISVDKLVDRVLQLKENLEQEIAAGIKEVQFKVE